MLKTVHAVLKKDGTYRLAEPLELSEDQHVLVTVIETEQDQDIVGGVPVTMRLSEPALSDWSRPEEDDAWKHLQLGTINSESDAIYSRTEHHEG